MDKFLMRTTAAVIAVGLGITVLVATSDDAKSFTATEQPTEQTAPLEYETQDYDTPYFDEDTWEEDLRTEIQDGFNSDPATKDMACQGYAVNGVNDAQSAVDLMYQIAAEQGQTIEQFFDIYPSDLPTGVTMDDALLVAGDEVVEVCNL